MTQYINKSALVAEIERRREELQDKVENSDFIAGEVFIMNYFLSFLDTLEVKEMDLEKEIDKWYNNETSKEFENVLYSDIEKFAKRFFELGLKARKGE